jgi:hypothetical protein
MTKDAKGGGYIMRQQQKPVTPEILRKYFGKDAGITGFLGDYRVTTPSGGLVRFWGEKAKVVYGGDDVYRATVQTAGECWGSLTANGLRDRDLLIGLMAHGEALGVRVQPSFRDRKATAKRWVLSALLYFLLCMMLGPDDRNASSASGGDAYVWISLLIAVVFFLFLRRQALREEQRRIEAGGFHLPRGGAGGAGYADDDDLRKGGLIS